MFNLKLKNYAFPFVYKRKGKSGVYLITNLINNKQYVGSALTKKSSENRLYIRFRNHFFNNSAFSFLKKKGPPLIKQAINKYGVENFSWEILEFTQLENTRSRETHYIQTLQPDYNILQFAENTQGYQHTESTREKMKANYSEFIRNRIGNLNRGKQLSAEIWEKLSQSAKARTLEQKQRHQESCDSFNKQKFSKPTQILDGDSLKVLGNYSNLREACNAWNGDYRTFKRCVKSGKKLTKLNIYIKYFS